MKLRVFVLVAVLLFVLGSQVKTVSAAESMCGYVPEKGKDPTFQQVNCILTTLAKKHGVPPEIAKAVATQEKGNWDQFDDNGEAIVSDDGGIGIMQITSYAPEKKERLENDAIFNIEEGIKRLASNFTRNDLPKINDHDPEKLESWYFAIMAYNGIKPVNSPFEKCLKPEITRNLGAYQEKVYSTLETTYEITTKIDQIPFKSGDFDYSCGSRNNINFLNKQYDLGDSLTTSKELYTQQYDYVEVTTNTNIRKTPTTGNNVITSITKGSIVSIQNDMAYDAVTDRQNRFGWFPVQTIQSETKSGFITSKYINRIGTRIFGESRYETAVQISKAGWNNAHTVILARGDDFPDALAGGPLAYELDSPILLTHSHLLTGVTERELIRLKAEKVIILGGTGAINQSVEKKLNNLGITVERIYGKNRYETAVEIAEKLETLGGRPTKAIIAYGGNFPDALAIAPYAARHGYPILLTRKDNVPISVSKTLSSINERIVVGGTGVIEEKVRETLRATRISGKDRYSTAVEIVKGFSFDESQIFFTNGTNFADALTGSVLAAKYNAPLLLVETNRIRPVVSENVNELEHFNLLGGKVAISERLVSDFQRLSN